MREFVVAMQLLAALQPAAEAGSVLPLGSVVPFALLLAAIAILPLAAPRFWESNRDRAIVVALLAVPFAAWLYGVHGERGLAEIRHAALDYLAFMALLGAL